MLKLGTSQKHREGAEPTGMSWNEQELVIVAIYKVIVVGSRNHSDANVIFQEKYLRVYFTER